MENLETEGRRKPEVKEKAPEFKENEIDPELAAAASMERADYLVREVKTNKNQMQNIIVHMQAVLKAIRELREALQLPESTGDSASVEQDKKRVQDLQKKIAEYRSELLQMKDELIAEQIRILKEKNPGQEEAVLQKEANALIEKLLVAVETN